MPILQLFIKIREIFSFNWHLQCKYTLIQFDIYVAYSAWEICVIEYDLQTRQQEVRLGWSGGHIENRQRPDFVEHITEVLYFSWDCDTTASKMPFAELLTKDTAAGRKIYATTFQFLVNTIFV